MADQQSTIERVLKLLELARDPRTPVEEADSAEQMANRLMAKHAIDESMAYAAQSKEERERPTSREIKLFDIAGYEFRNEYEQIIAWLKKLCRVEVVNLREIGLFYVAGFDADVRYFETLWATIHLQWIAKLKPKFDKEKFDESVYNFVLAGYKWKEIAVYADIEWDRKKYDGGRLKRAYTRYCKDNNITPENHTQRHDAYRRSFARSFAQRLSYRLMDMVTENEDTTKTAGAEVAIRDRHSDVMEMMYEQFPHLRPLSAEELQKMKDEETERERKRQEEFDAWFAGLTDKQREAYWRKQQREQERQQRRSDRYWDEFDRRNTDPRGSSLGRSAADAVDLKAGRGSVGDAEREALS